MGLGAGGTAGALLAVELTGRWEVAGLPTGMLVGGSAVGAVIIAWWSGRWGRPFGLAAGYLLGAVGAVTVIAGAMAESLATVLVGSWALGMANPAIFLTRYAAAELGGRVNRGQALGVVLTAVAVGAVLSPNLLGPSGDLAVAVGLPRLTGLYLVAVTCFPISTLVLATTSAPTRPDRPTRLRRIASNALRTPSARAAILVLAVVNFAMVAVMAMAPVHLAHHGQELGTIGLVVAIHVVGMFLPSPLSGWAVDRVGGAFVAGTGLILTAVAGVLGGFVAESGPGIVASLVVLGIGWNAGVIGASTLLTVAVSASHRPHVEGIGEVAMGIAAAIGAPVAGMIAASAGYRGLSLLAGCAAALGLLACAIVGERTTGRYRQSNERARRD